MQSEWKGCSLGDVLELQRGFDLPIQDRRPGSVPVVASTGVIDFHHAAQVQGPGVVIGRSGSIGGGQYLKGDFWPLNTTLWVKDFKGNLPRYCYYLLRSIDFTQFNAGSGVPTLNRNHIHPLPIRLAPRAEQHLIVDFLGALDDRIDLLRQTNATLEFIAQALFKSWFIDFDPVRAKAEGREPEGMDAATAALFPSEFEESALGAIPKEWSVAAFGDFATLSKGSVSPSSSPATTFEHYSLPAFDENQLPVFEAGEAIKSNKTLVPQGAVLQSKLNPHIPRVWLPGDVGDHAVCSTEFLPWVARESSSASYVYTLLRSPAFEAQVRTLVTGTSNSHQRVRPDQVASLRVVSSTTAVRLAFTDLVEPLLRKAVGNRLHMRTLAEVRDLLLPRLISGKLRLPEAHEQIDEVCA